MIDEDINELDMLSGFSSSLPIKNIIVYGLRSTYLVCTYNDISKIYNVVAEFKDYSLAEVYLKLIS